MSVPSLTLARSAALAGLFTPAAAPPRGHQGLELRVGHPPDAAAGSALARRGRVAQRRGLQPSVADQVVDYMIFANEAKLYDTLVGDSAFSQTFPLLGPRDKQGRSLRDFDLHKRLFKYPLSHMIYSETFDGMPDIAKQMVYQKIYDVLTGKNKSDQFANLSPADRQAVLEIVRDTKPGLPDYWK